jgi:hypothetical protein
MSTYIVVEEATGMIVNRIALDDPTQWQPPDGHLLIEDSDNEMMIGGSYSGDVYTPPPQSKPPTYPPAPAPETALLYDHENRLRVIEGEPPLTLADFIMKTGTR